MRSNSAAPDRASQAREPGRGGGFPGAELLSPLPLLGLVLMVLNDHWLRVHWPGWITGKLSDFAVVLFFPFLLTATYGLLLVVARPVVERVARGRLRLDARLTRFRLAGAIAVTGLVLAGINLFTWCRDAYVALLTRLDVLGLWGSFVYVVDPSDCVALGLLPVVWLWGKRYAMR